MAGVAVECEAGDAGHADPVAADCFAVAGAVDAVARGEGEAGEAGGAGVGGGVAVDRAEALTVLEEGAEAAGGAEGVVGGVGGEAGGAAFEAVAVVVEGVGRLADEALVGRAVEGALGDRGGVDAAAGDAEFEAFDAGEADQTGGVAVVAVGGAAGGEAQEGEQHYQFCPKHF